MNWPLIISSALYAALGVQAIGFALAALGLNVHFGYTGLLNFGQAGFMLVGAYSVAIPVTAWGWNYFACLPFVVVTATVFALLLGVPTLKLRSDYLAIVTIAAAEILRLLMSTPKWTSWSGGTDGINSFTEDFRNRIPDPTKRYFLWKQPLTAFDLWVIIMGWTLVAVFALFVWAVIRSPWGRVLRSIREDEDAARSLGKNVFAYKMQALIIGGVLGALGGLMLAFSTNVNSSVYVTSLTFFLWTALLLGGAATVFGPLAGSIIFWVLQAFLGLLFPALADAGLMPFTTIQAAQIKFIIVGFALVLLVVFRPQGLFGNKKELTFVK
jgi:branched-chain amino acid transport system permease protein